MESGNCVTPLAPQGNIFIGPAPGYSVFGNENIPMGYLQPFCYRCTIQPLGGLP